MGFLIGAVEVDGGAETLDCRLMIVFPGLKYAEIVMGFGIFRIEFDCFPEVVLGAWEIASPDPSYTALGIGDRGLGIARNEYRQIAVRFLETAATAKRHATPEIGFVRCIVDVESAAEVGDRLVECKELEMGFAAFDVVVSLVSGRS